MDLDTFILIFFRDLPAPCQPQSFIALGLWMVSALNLLGMACLRLVDILKYSNILFIILLILIFLTKKFQVLRFIFSIKNEHTYFGTCSQIGSNIGLDIWVRRLYENIVSQIWSIWSGM